MKMKEAINRILVEQQETLSRLKEEQAEVLISDILKADKIFVAGAGRSGFVAKGFAMRLMHMGFEVYVCGETITPNLRESDMLLIISGSGETGSLIAMVEKANKIGAKTATVTINPQGAIGTLTADCVQIMAPSPKLNTENHRLSIQPMGTLFEQCSQIFLDAVILRLMEEKQDDSEHMFQRHANLE